MNWMERIRDWWHRPVLDMNAAVEVQIISLAEDLADMARKLEFLTDICANLTTSHSDARKAHDELAVELHRARTEAVGLISSQVSALHALTDRVNAVEVAAQRAESAAVQMEVGASHEAEQTRRVMESEAQQMVERLDTSEARLTRLVSGLNLWPVWSPAAIQTWEAVRYAAAKYDSDTGMQASRNSRSVEVAIWAKTYCGSKNWPEPPAGLTDILLSVHDVLQPGGVHV
jgi:chromosome segregation ATPase